jgi:sterol 14-demethylase
VATGKATPAASEQGELRLESLSESSRGQLHVVIDRQLCQGHAACMAEAPEIFQVDSQGKLTVLMEAPSSERYGQLRQAKRYCPTRAITLVES